MLKEILIGISGFTAGLLLAPASGGETRSALAAMVADAIEAAGDQYDLADKTLRKTARKASDFAETASDVAAEQYARARKHGRRAAKTAKEFQETMEETYSQARKRAADVLPIAKKQCSTGTMVSRVALGAGVGFGLALLFTPKRGADLRDDIVDAAQSFAGGIKKGYREQRAAAGAGAWTGTTGVPPDYT